MPSLTRDDAYELAWSAPMRELAERHGLSDVGLKKALSRLDIPFPPQGHWNKVHAGKATVRTKLPPRGPGMPTELLLGDSPVSHWPYDPLKVLAEPEPERPVFPEPLDSLRERVAKQVGRIICPRDLRQPHPAVRRVLDADEKRREKHEASSWGDWHAPWFDSPFERRRLRVLNGIFLGLTRLGAKPEIGSQKGRPLTVQVGAQTVAFLLDHPAARKNRHGEWEVRTGREDELKLVVSSDLAASGVPTWSDGEGGKLEAFLPEIVVDILVQGEVLYRERSLATFEWRMEARDRAREELRKRKDEAERLAKERRLQEEREARQALLDHARAHREAGEIRTLVAAVRERTKDAGETCGEALGTWAAWALAVADALDPLEGMRVIEGGLSFNRETT